MEIKEEGIIIGLVNKKNNKMKGYLHLKYD
jgi:hypothetical protein